MNPALLKAGAELYVPAGADPTRTHPYYCRVIEVYKAAGETESGYAHFRAEIIRADGRPSRRRPGRLARDAGFTSATRAVMADPARIRPRAEAQK